VERAITCKILLEQDHVGLALVFLKPFQVCFVILMQLGQGWGSSDYPSFCLSIASDCFPVDDQVTAETATPQNKSFHLL
jgi:hypothetical protein